MDTKYKLIGGAQKRAEDIQQIAENFKQLATSINEDPMALMEGATQVLAGLKAAMAAGQPLTKLGLSPASLAGVVAGIRVLTRALPKMSDPNKKLRALKVLGDLKVGDQMSLGSTTAIANLADKDPQLDELRNAFNQYGQSNQPNAQLLKVLGQLQVEIDQAMRAAQASGQEKGDQAATSRTNPAPAQAAGQQPGSTPPPAMASGTVSTVGSAGRG